MTKSRFPLGARDLAVRRLRTDLSAGRWSPGTSLEVAALAAELGMSASPVREALAQLLGERVLEASHRNGFAVPRLMPHELAEEYRLLAMLADGLAEVEPPALPDPDDLAINPSLLRVIWSLAHRTGATAVMPIIVGIRFRIAAYLRAEPVVLHDYDLEAAALAQAIAEGCQSATRDSFRLAVTRRIAAAPAICRAAENSPKSFDETFD